MAEREGVTAYYRLDVVAELVGLPAARIRAYERAGLIRPRAVAGRQRLYGDAELARLRRLRRLATHLGLNAAGVEVVARLLDDIEQLHAELAELRASQ